MFYDAHAHLDMLTKEELASALKSASAAQVGQIISCSTSFASNQKNLLLAEKHSQIRPALGLYPLDLIELTDAEINKAFVFFEENIKKAIALGEVGLDFKYCKKKEEQEKQELALSRFAQLSKKYSKPLIIHSRFAQKQVLKLLLENKAEKVLLHSFVDSQKLMKQAAENGYFVSVGLSVCLNKEISENISHFPLDNLLFETDSPIKFGGEKAFPEHLICVVKKVAELRGISLTELEGVQEQNFQTLFH